MPEYRNRIGCNVSGTPGTGTITLGAALSGHQAFTTFGATKVVDILIEEGANWEICRDCTFSNTNNTVTRGTLEESSSGSRVSFTSAAKVYLTQTAQRVGASVEPTTIRGLAVSYATDTSIGISSGYIYIQGKRYAKGTYGIVTIDGTTALGGATLASNSLIDIFAYDSGGVLAYGWQRRTGDSTSVDSSKDSAWYSSNLGEGYRYIGSMRTAAASNALRPGYHVSDVTGNIRRFMFKEPYQILNVTGTTASSITVNAHFPATTRLAFLNIGVGVTTGSGIAAGSVSNYSDLNTTTIFNSLVRLYASEANSTMWSGVSTVPVESWGSLFAEAATATNYITVLNAGFEYEV